jgi:hypothetical protein
MADCGMQKLKSLSLLPKMPHPLHRESQLTVQYPMKPLLYFATTSEDEEDGNTSMNANASQETEIPTPSPSGQILCSFLVYFAWRFFRRICKFHPVG